MKIAILGAGMVGRAMALDLAANYSVTSFDVSQANLDTLKKRNAAIQTVQADLQQYSRYAEWLQPFDLVVTAVPGFMGFKTLQTVIECGKNIADISFFPENSLDLDALAKEKGVTVITDVGVAPGMSNFILGHYDQQMKVSSFECYVGGLPKYRKKPFEYKAPFSPVDVIEEYVRPARLKENGHIVVKPALSEPELMEFAGVGTLEAFNTDGLRSLLFTMPHIPTLKEKTLRYPGHIELISALKAAGFFSETPITFGDTQVSPLQFTSKILFKEWKLGETEEELTVMQVAVEGTKDGKAQRVQYDMLDRYDPDTQISSMSRTTGYTCDAAANLILKGMFTKKGVFPPELVGSEAGCFEFVMNYLKNRGVVWNGINTF
ncbi:MAG: saccharopine dehydrogenase NADP-binding domain-containing protein [Saprospiraceae bacterium]|nr:saccharopine dehydrogenase NADP-binding domain-containing protein [Saprospiraceae bacterium]